MKVLQSDARVAPLLPRELAHEPRNEQRKVKISALRHEGRGGFGRGAIAVAAALVALSVTVVPASETASPHAYFDSLVARVDHWRSYSLRSEAQLASPHNGGFANSNSDPLAVTYNPAEDTNPNAQDAAKVVIPAFQQAPVAKLVSPVSANALTLPLSDLAGDVTRVTTSMNAKGRQVRIGNEVIILNTDVTPLNRETGFVTVSQRGAYGTTAAPHSADSLVAIGTNSLSNQVRLPFQSHDGATWFLTWDTYFTDSYLNNGIGNFKAFQLSSGGSFASGGTLWLEPNVHFNGAGVPGFDPSIHVGATGQMRRYGAVDQEPPLEGVSPIPHSGNNFFKVHPNRWTRWFVRIEQRANALDVMDHWVADEVTEPVMIYNQVPVNVRMSTDTGTHTIHKFWIEFNTSTAQLAPGRTTDFRDLVAYVRNVAILRNPPADVSELLLRPGTTEPVPRPPAPSNLRILNTSP